MKKLNRKQKRKSNYTKIAIEFRASLNKTTELERAITINTINSILKINAPKRDEKIKISQVIQVALFRTKLRKQLNQLPKEILKIYKEEIFNFEQFKK